MATICATTINATVTGTAGNDDIYGFIGNDLLFGGAGNDVFEGGFGNDFINGGDGVDWLFGDAGNDILYGGRDSASSTGEDVLAGSIGSDIYLFDRNCGADRISDCGYLPGERDTLYIDANSDQLWFRSANGQYGTKDLVIDIMGSQDAVGNSTNKVTIQGQFSNTDTPVEWVMTRDHKVMAAADFGRMVQALSGLSETVGATSLYDSAFASSQSRWLPVERDAWKSADAKTDNLINAMAQLVQSSSASTTPTIADTQSRVTAVLAASALV